MNAVESAVVTATTRVATGRRSLAPGELFARVGSELFPASTHPLHGVLGVVGGDTIDSPVPFERGVALSLSDQQPGTRVRHAGPDGRRREIGLSTRGPEQIRRAPFVHYHRRVLDEGVEADHGHVDGRGDYRERGGAE